MKISLNWLREYVDISCSAEDLAKALTRIGLSCEEILQAPGDAVLNLEITSNRPDCLGHLGVAREVAAMTGVPLRSPKIKIPKTGGKVGELTSVEVSAPDLCPRYTARLIRGVKVGPSPSWMVQRLEAVGLRSVNNVVDVTNYVLMEYSQPLHSFDFDKLAGRRIVVRRAKAGEEIVSIDGTRCRLDDSMLVIADAEKAVAVAGVMGGANTEVGGGTAHVLIESAQFDPLSVRRTSRKLALMSESNYRFERGVDPVGVEQASLRACQLIMELAGGELAEGIVDVWAKPFVPPTVALRPRRCDALLGIEIPPRRQMEILAKLHLSPRMEGDKIICTIPPWRGDLVREVDLIEEIIRLEGYDKIPVTDRITHSISADNPVDRVRRQAAAAAQAGGFDEALTLTFIEPAEAALFCDAPAVCVDSLVRKTDNALRPTLIPSLLRVCKTNQDAGNADVDLFEISAVFPPTPAGRRGKPGPRGAMDDEHLELAMVTTRDLAVLRGTLEAVVERLAGQVRLEVQPAAAKGMSNSASGNVLLDDKDGKAIGVIGVVAPEVLDHYGLARPVAAAAVRFDALLAAAQEAKVYQPLPRFPAVRRDLSLIVDEDMAWKRLAEAIAAVPQPMRVAVDYVTTYRGKPVAAGRKSVTVTLTYRAADQTLRSEQVDRQVAEVVEALRKGLAAELRA
jgi:phenylalanyl-tRNA synthetase beta chain